jgi:catechol 2,3-dioxygenase-like lactoylglutathione lyase family enzyme
MMQVDYGAAIFVRNLDKALGFYTEKLGFKLKDRGSRRGVSWVEVALPKDDSAEPPRIALMKFERVPQIENRIGGHTGLVFVTDDLHGACESLKDKDVLFEWEPKSRPWNCSDAQFLDEDNNKILLVERGNELEVLRSHRPTE